MKQVSRKKRGRPPTGKQLSNFGKRLAVAFGTEEAEVIANRVRDFAEDEKGLSYISIYNYLHTDRPAMSASNLIALAEASNTCPRWLFIEKGPMRHDATSLSESVEIDASENLALVLDPQVFSYIEGVARESDISTTEQAQELLTYAVLLYVLIGDRQDIRERRHIITEMLEELQKRTQGSEGELASSKVRKQ